MRAAPRRAANVRSLKFESSTSTLDEAVTGVAYVNAWEVVYGVCGVNTYNIVNGACAQRQPRQSNISPRDAGYILYIAALLARWETARTVHSKLIIR